MVLYLCLIPNRGARIGHQTDDHYRLVTYCKKNGFIFVYHPFTGHSQKFENALKFGHLHSFHYQTAKKEMDKIVSIQDLEVDLPDLHNKLLELHQSDEKIMLFDSICGNEKYSSICNINHHDIIDIKKGYRNVLLKYYKKPVNGNYICIHIRCGDIENDPSRYLSVQYFIDKYKELITKMETDEKMPVYIVTEQNFKDIDLLNENIKNCTIVQTDEITSFYYLVYSTYLIASRSGFSNLAYILGNMRVLKAPLDWNCYWDNLIE